MEANSKMYFIIKLLTHFGFIHQKFNRTAKLKIFSWMTISICLGSGTLYEDIEVIMRDTLSRPSTLFTFLSADILIPLQTCLTFPLLGHLVLVDKEILEDKELPAPRRILHLIFFSILAVGSYSCLLYNLQ